MPKQVHRPQDESLHLILDAVAASSQPLTRTQIAAALNRRKTPHLISLIEKLVTAGYLTREVKTFPNGVQGYVYAPSEPR